MTGHVASQQLADWVVPHSHAGKLKNWRTRQTTQPRVPAQGNKVSKPLAVKILWGLQWWEKLPVAQESLLEGPIES